MLDSPASILPSPSLPVSALQLVTARKAASPSPGPDTSCVVTQTGPSSLTRARRQHAGSHGHLLRARARARPCRPQGRCHHSRGVCKELTSVTGPKPKVRKSADVQNVIVQQIFKTLNIESLRGNVRTSKDSPQILYKISQRWNRPGFITRQRTAGLSAPPRSRHSLGSWWWCSPPRGPCVCKSGGLPPPAVCTCSSGSEARLFSSPEEHALI